MNTCYLLNNEIKQSFTKYRLVNLDYENESFKIIEEFAGNIIETHIKTKEILVREGLIKLGWTPPK